MFTRKFFFLKYNKLNSFATLKNPDEKGYQKKSYRKIKAFFDAKPPKKILVLRFSSETLPGKSLFELICLILSFKS